MKGRDLIALQYQYAKVEGEKLRAFHRSQRESLKLHFPELDKLFKLLHADVDGILKQSVIDFTAVSVAKQNIPESIPKQ